LPTFHDDWTTGGVTRTFWTSWISVGGAKRIDLAQGVDQARRNNP
jgi:hypothetical protein